MHRDRLGLDAVIRDSGFHHAAAVISILWITVYEESCRNYLFAGLPWGLNFNAHTHPIPTEKPAGIPTESPYPQNPEILHTRTLHPVYFCLMHISFLAERNYVMFG